MMFMILNMSKLQVNKNNLNPPDAVANASANSEINLNQTLPNPIHQPLPSAPESISETNQANPPDINLADDLTEAIAYKVDIAPELLTELLEISDNPTAIVDEAIRWWLRRRNVDALDSGTRHRRYPVGISSHRSLQNQWND